MFYRLGKSQLNILLKTKPNLFSSANRFTVYKQVSKLTNGKGFPSTNRISSLVHNDFYQNEENRKSNYQRNKANMSTMTVFCLTALLAQVYLIKKNIYALGTFWKKEDQSQFVDSDPVDDVHLENIVKKDNIVPGEYNAQLRTYTLDDVSKHNVPDVGIWIVYKAGVYDITSFVQSHPGGDAVLLGAGNSVEPFWEIYPQHKTQQVYQILESYRIGNLREEDRLKPDDLVKSSDIFDFVPDREIQSHVIHHEQPFNSETLPDVLVKSFYTSNTNFFIRNHLSVPSVDVNEYTLEIAGHGLSKSFTFTLEQIKTLFPKHTVSSVIQCAGNRRSEFNKLKEVKGIAWRTGAIGNAKWSGAKLIDVLRYCGADLQHPDIKHVQADGLDFDVSSVPYGASIPADIALDPNGEVLLAYEMNDEPIPPDHGFPIRLIIPGVVGARNVKWLSRVTLSSTESDSHWQRNDYKSFPSNKDSATKSEFDSATAIQQLPIQSAICTPKDGDQVKLSWKCKNNVDLYPVIEATGYAFSGGGKDIIRVDLSIDGGKTWFEADLIKETPNKSPHRTYSWTLWKVDLLVDAKQLLEHKNIQIICRAFDASYNTQPSNTEEIWNFRGLLNNSYHRINISLI